MKPAVWKFVSIAVAAGALAAGCGQDQASSGKPPPANPPPATGSPTPSPTPPPGTPAPGGETPSPTPPPGATPSPTPTPTPPIEPTPVPPTGPALGKGNPASMGLDRHDALYCGEWQLTNPGETIYLIKGGKVVWSHAIPDNDELGDCTITTNGHVLFARKAYGAQEIEPDMASGKDGKIVWEYKKDGGEVHSVQPLGADKVLVMQNGPPAKLMLIDKTKAPSCTFGMPCVEKHWTPESHGTTHGMFRHVRMLANGNLLVPYTGGAQNRVVEYKPTSDTEWMPVWQFPKDPVANPTLAAGAWAAARLRNGNTLISGNANLYVREVNPAGELVWELTQKDVPDITLWTVQEAMRLSNGNTIVNNWCGGKGYPKDQWKNCVQVFEVTPDKKVVWKVQQWTDPNLGPGSSTQLLDEPGTPENPGELQR